MPLPPNALDLNDPKSLISQTITSYRSPMAQTIQGNGGVGAPTAPAVSAAPKGAAEISSKADYDRLPPGAVFMHKGKQFVKPGAALAPGEM